MSEWCRVNSLVSIQSLYISIATIMISPTDKRDFFFACVYCRFWWLPVQGESTRRRPGHWYYSMSWFSFICDCVRNNPICYIHRFPLLPLDFPFHELGGAPSAVTGKRFRTWLLQLRNSNCVFRDKQSSLIDAVLDGYNTARHGAEVSRASYYHQ